MNEGDFEYLCAVLHEESGLALGPDKVYLVEARLGPLARREGLGSVAALLERLRRGVPALRRQVVEAMLTTETSFFRDAVPFEALRRTILPELLRRRTTRERLHLWCGASSSGQEPYSLAMLLREHFPGLAGTQVRILASDLSGAVLERARQGVYSQLEVNRGLPARLLVKYFRREGLDWRIADDIRSLVDFFPLNLVGAWPVLPPVDVALVRNVLIYFDLPQRKQVLGRIRRHLRPDGYLFLGGGGDDLRAGRRLRAAAAGRGRLLPAGPAG